LPGLISLVMPGLVPGIRVFAPTNKKDVDGRDKPGHDETWATRFETREDTLLTMRRHAFS
jgi:hypothetical protein